MVVAMSLSWWPGLHSSGPTAAVSAAATTVDSSLSTTAVWPVASSGVRYLTPAAATIGFASGLLHMTTPSVTRGSTSPGGSVTVTLRATTGGPSTLVNVARSTKGFWWVTRASSARIVVSRPTPFAQVASPLRVSGRSVAFEGVVNVEVRDAAAATLLATTVRGGSTGLQSFTSTLRFHPPHSGYGDLVLFERSAKDGSVTCATVERLRF